MGWHNGPPRHAVGIGAWLPLAFGRSCAPCGRSRKVRRFAQELEANVVPIGHEEMPVDPAIGSDAIRVDEIPRHPLGGWLDAEKGPAVQRGGPAADNQCVVLLENIEFFAAQ